MSRPIPLHSDVEGVLIDIEAWRTDAEKDGVITPDEAMRAVPLLLVLASLVRMWVATIAHVSTCIQSAKGMFSQRAIRGWNQAHKQCPDNVVPFHREFDPEVA